MGPKRTKRYDHSERTSKYFHRKSGQKKQALEGKRIGKATGGKTEVEAVLRENNTNSKFRSKVFQERMRNPYLP